jgi:hypothetical protein
MIGEPDAGNPHVRFDEGRQETCVRAARLSPTLQSPRSVDSACYPGSLRGALSAIFEFGGRNVSESRMKPFLIIDTLEEFANA